MSREHCLSLYQAVLESTIAVGTAIAYCRAAKTAGALHLPPESDLLRLISAKDKELIYVEEDLDCVLTDLAARFCNLESVAVHEDAPAHLTWLLSVRISQCVSLIHSCWGMVSMLRSARGRGDAHEELLVRFLGEMRAVSTDLEDHLSGHGLAQALARPAGGY